MKIWDFKPSGDLFTTVAVGAAVAAAPIVLPFAWSAVRPLLKTVSQGRIHALRNRTGGLQGRC